MPASRKKTERIFRGIPVSAGVCRGKVRVLVDPKDDAIPRYAVADEDLEKELKRLDRGLAETRKEILEVQRQVASTLGVKDASIFDAHLLVLEDPTLIEEVTRRIQQDKLNAESAFHEFAEKYASTLSESEDEYLRERAGDMRDVSSRILANLMGKRRPSSLKDLSEPCILVSHDLTPSQTAMMDKRMVLGFVTDAGSRTSHTAILARSLRIAAVVGLSTISQELGNGQEVLIDGYNGLVVLNPTDQTLFEYGQIVRRHASLEESLREGKDKAATTRDGFRIALSANIESPDDIESVKSSGAEGVGLFRTEYLFINRQKPPTEEEQYDAYHKVAVALHPCPVIIRTLDLGGDKILSHLNVPQEMNPFLGWRAIRFCLEEKEIFRAQLRAILRASVAGNVKMMYPMISGLDELLQANGLVDEVRAELRAKGTPFDEKLEVGSMIEIPSAALASDALAKRSCFFSLGTNDLIQYSMAVDRLNEKIAHLYEPTHPAILRLIHTTVQAGKRRGIWTGICGEMGSDPQLTPLLLGLGITEFSVASSAVPTIKYLIRQTTMSEAVALAEAALECESGAEILERSRSYARKIAPTLFEDDKV
ncbi:MAG: phosphoenolpyruvate--protein phosphotransferase [Verrucomicrobia bacterium]|nr:phosphoenolpyruvate--protein phosphotransferase [Verrucomicrobiota bacterium]MBI3868355.1 phosphoenolpyruvate--protein phosphotransferase [Verrucomicrobiota bacterium]